MIVHETLDSAINQRARLVVAPVTTADALSRASGDDLAVECDLVELRIDGLVDDLDLARSFARSCKCPILVTVRHPCEGGENQLSASDRIGLFQEFLPFAAAVDIEIRSLEELETIVTATRSDRRLLVTSSHDFEGMPSPSTLKKHAETAAAIGGILKIAATPTSIGDLFSLAEFTATISQSLPVSAMGMGRFGRLSRLACAQAGSVLNYGYLSTPNAPGQWPAGQLKTLIAQLLE